eukprot:NODE_491_length_1445_cov_160.299697_g457_i0.p1 GENE.NODE_491_length_1445_cov_160.299697_g457_i0~~NODE_491_length_1445_cov_160.299697_g457_i0.p1  ORF type:complete len:398 (+),score=86.31 NODE_491_length_1445_cov_160.299697_g457_i0:117-1310(+)
MTKLPNFEYAGGSPGAVSPSTSSSKPQEIVSKVKLRNRIKLELVQDECLEDEAKLRLVEILDDLDQGDINRVNEKNELRLRKFEQAEAARKHQEEERTRQQQLRDTAVSDRLNKANEDRAKKMKDASDKRQQKIQIAATKKANKERETMRKSRQSDLRRRDRYSAMQDHQKQMQTDIASKRAERERRRDQVLENLELRTMEREKAMDMKAYEKEVTIGLANARRRAQADDKAVRDAQKRGHALEHSKDAITELHAQITERERQRDTRIQQLQDDRRKHLGDMVKKHEQREARAGEVWSEMNASRSAWLKSETDKRKRKEKLLSDKKQQLDRERQQRILELNHSRLDHYERARGAVEDWKQRKEEEENVRRKQRADRFFRALGMMGGGPGGRSGDYMV